MRTSNLFLMVAVFFFGWTSSTLVAQRYSRPVVVNKVSVQAGYQGISQPVAIVASNPSVPGYNCSGLWYPYVIARPADRSWMREMPVANRPNRPLHFWGNSRRRLR